MQPRCDYCLKHYDNYIAHLKRSDACFLSYVRDNINRDREGTLRLIRSFVGHRIDDAIYDHPTGRIFLLLSPAAPPSYDPDPDLYIEVPYYKHIKDYLIRSNRYRITIYRNEELQITVFKEDNGEFLKIFYGDDYVPHDLAGFISVGV